MAYSQSQERLAFFFFIILSLTHRVTGTVITCPVKCYNNNAPLVRFPFRLITQPDRCGYPGFDVLCTNNITKTAIRLPNSGQFIINSIDYVTQTLIINDPDSCLPRRFLDQSFNLAGSPFDGQADDDPLQFTFLNCSSSSSSDDHDHQMSTVDGLRTVVCLSGANFTVVAVPTYNNNNNNNNKSDLDHQPSPSTAVSSCSVVNKVPVSVPVLWPVWSDLSEGVKVKWNVPDCTSCEERGGFCGFKNDDMQLGCANLQGSSGLPKSAKYGIIIGVGIPGLLCIIGIGCYLGSKLRTFYRRPDVTTEFGTTIMAQTTVALTGLDKPTIESYPKTVIGESGQLLKPNDNTCIICLCEYQPNETLRTIPQCNHYYHAKCIDEWLKINASCPLCRNSKESSIIITPSSSSASLSSSSLMGVS